MAVREIESKLRVSGENPSLLNWIAGWWRIEKCLLVAVVIDELGILEFPVITEVNRGHLSYGTRTRRTSNLVR
jgi:hypothetical protein